MIYPEYDDLESWGSKYALVALAAKRAKQIKSGAPILVETQSRNPLTIALEEIASGKITCVVSEDDLPQPSPVEPGIADLLAIPIDEELDEESSAEDAVETEAHAEDLLAHDDETHDELPDDEEVEDHEDAWQEVLDEDSGEVIVVEPSVALEPEEQEALSAPHPADEVEEAAAKPRRRRGRPPAAEKAIEQEVLEVYAAPEAEEAQIDEV